jgi:hypothetical protein
LATSYATLNRSTILIKDDFVGKSRFSRKDRTPFDSANREPAQNGRTQRACGSEADSPNVALTLKHFHRKENSLTAAESKRLYLKVGDEVNHLRYDEWGMGVVMEVMTSSVPGGTCLARVRFQDGQLRCFNNDLDNEACCYYFGLRRYWNPTHGVNAIRTRFFLRG